MVAFHYFGKMKGKYTSVGLPLTVKGAVIFPTIFSVIMSLFHFKQ